MLQREVAERLEAQPGTGDYGVLSISVQLHAGVKRLLTLPPGAFRPAPKVHSAVVRLTFRPPAAAPQTRVSSRRWSGPCSPSAGRPSPMRWRHSPQPGHGLCGGARGRRHRSQAPSRDPGSHRTDPPRRPVRPFDSRRSLRAGQVKSLISLRFRPSSVLSSCPSFGDPSQRVAGTTRVNPRLPAAARHGPSARMAPTRVRVPDFRDQTSWLGSTCFLFRDRRTAADE